ncbi:MAG: translocation/assembly module TamB domain-containing protein [Wenzhouxiangella sp.]|nr:translocation/assembly module TamB domain-containing protein [Wenzhouxiangella sp.]
MKKLLLIMGIVIVLLLVALASTWWWLTSTRSGAQWGLERAQGQLELLEWSSLEGSLRRGLVARDVVLEQAGVRVTVERLELAAIVRLPPGLSAEVDWVRAFGVDVYLPEPAPEPPEPEPFTLPDLASPVPVRVSELRVERLAIHPFAEEPVDPFEIQRIELAGEYHQRLDLDHLRVAMDESRLAARGHWQLAEPFGGELDLELSHRLDEVQFDARLGVSGRLAALEIDLDTQGPLQAQGQVRLRGLPGDFDATVRLDGEFGDWPQLDYRVRDIELNASGGIAAWQARLGARVEGPDIPANRIVVEVTGDTRELNIESLRVEALGGELEARGRMLTTGELDAALDVRLEGLDLTELYPDWPERARLGGRLELSAAGDTIRLAALELSAPPTALTLSGSGYFEPEADRLDLSLDWRDLYWPPVAEASERLFASESGRVRLRGAISDWQLELDALMRAFGQPPVRVRAEASGDEHQARVQRLHLDADRYGRVEVSGEVGWAPEPRGALSLALIDADPGQFVAELPGQISSQLELRFDSTTDLVLDLVNIDGELRGQPVSGQGAIAIQEERPEAGSLALDFGDNRLTIDSRDGREWQWRLEGRALHQVWPELSGSLALQGRVDPFARQLQIDGRVEASSIGDITLREAALSASVDWNEPPQVALSLGVDDLDLNPWERIERIEFELDGSCREHRFGLNLSAQRGSLDLGGGGALPDCLTGGRAWTGALDRFYLAETLAGDWVLSQPLAISAAPDGIEAGPGCLVETATREGRLCLRRLEIDGDSQVEIGIEQVPMDLMLLALDPGFNLTNRLSGEISAAWSEREGLRDVTGFLALGSGGLTPLGSDDMLLAIDSLRLDLQPEGEEFVLDLEALLEGDSELRGQARLLDLNDLSSATVDASARLNLPDIGVFNRLVAELDQLGGSLAADVALSGPLLGPAVQGQARLRDGLVVQAPLGLRISQIELDLDGANDRARLSGRMLSGEGHLSINGELAQDDGKWAYEVTVDGQRFSFADASWLQLDASPSLRVASRGERLALDGDIHIDRLRAGLPPGSEDRVSVSDDVRVLGETDEDEDQPELRLEGRLGIHLGNDARLAALGMQAVLAGDLELLWEPNSALPRGRGMIRLPEGSYRAYGQNLEIRDGEVLFSGHPLDNPRLDIRAIRDIFGDPQVDEAGVHIRGPARNPTITLFTEPPTSEEKALAYVITGADFDHAGGQGAVNVGFYLLPRLFVSYGIGLFEAGNVLSGRFELSRRWGVRVVSGERDTGVDLSFALDR